MIINGKALLEAAPIKDMIPYKVQAHPTSYGTTECGYDIRIKQDIWFWPSGYAYKSSRSLIRPPAYAIGDKDDRFHGNFVLASSIECFQMPDHLMGQVLNKSTWARLGLDASMTTNIEPKWEGHLTLELTYHGTKELSIPAGSGICQVMFHEIKHHAKYDGKYDNQPDYPVEAK